MIEKTPLQKVLNDPAVKAELDDANSNDQRVEALVSRIQEQGVTITPGEARTFLSSRVDEELSDDDLDGVAGGAGITVATDMAW